jgi:hypothetical protein
MTRLFTLVLFLSISFQIEAQPADKYILLKPAKVFDGETMHEGWVVLVKNNRVEQTVL